MSKRKPAARPRHTITRAAVAAAVTARPVDTPERVQHVQDVHVFQEETHTRLAALEAAVFGHGEPKPIDTTEQEQEQP